MDCMSGGEARGRRTDELVAITIAGERFGAFVYPVAVLIVAVLRCYGREGFGDAVVEGVRFGFFVAHGLSLFRCFVCSFVGWRVYNLMLGVNRNFAGVSKSTIGIDQIDQNPCNTHLLWCC